MTTFSGNQPAYCQQDSLMKLSRCEWLPVKEEQIWSGQLMLLLQGWCILLNIVIIVTRPKPAFGRRAKMGSSFEYSYTCLASRLRRSSRWKCLETGEMTKPLEPCNIFQKCLETGETTNSLEIMTFFKGFCRFLVSRHFWIEKVCRNRKNEKNLWNNEIVLRDFVVFLFPDTFEYGKCLETVETTKSLE